MKPILSILFIFIVWSTFGEAQSRYPNSQPQGLNPFSETRYPGEQASQAYLRFLQRIPGQIRARIQQGAETALSEAKPFSQLDYSNVPKWESPAYTVQAFAKVRDMRFIQDPQHGGLMRRSSWLYPDDGCFARAALAGINLEKLKAIRPGKAFIFGNLQVKTANSPRGSVSWWYHVVPIVMVGQEAIILDPAIDPLKPLKLKDWIMTMTPDISTVKLSLCGPYSYGPSSTCATSDPSEDGRALTDQMGYLVSEWARLLELHRDPTRELGDFPPWPVFFK